VQSATYGCKRTAKESIHTNHYGLTIILPTCANHLAHLCSSSRQGNSRSKIAPGSTHDHVGINGRKSYNSYLEWAAGTSRISKMAGYNWGKSLVHPQKRGFLLLAIATLVVHVEARRNPPPPPPPGNRAAIYLQHGLSQSTLQQLPPELGSHQLLVLSPIFL
jgi:hypothetical protein